MDSTFVSTELVGGVLVAHLKCEKVAEREATVISGELVTQAAAHAWKLALDMTEVMLLASVGLGALVTLNKNCKAKGGKLVVYGLASELAEVLKITRLDRVLTIVKDRDAGVKALA